ncbi:MAG: hypothetical protein PF637_10275 [Spirochaetes bacterium]|jgi:hypothetical protein|nr:hypothetical protein [Spirochaetota bacterium]
MFKQFVFTFLILLAALPLISCGDPWVAKINGEKLTLEELNNFYYANHVLTYKKSSNEEVDELAANPEEVQKNPYLSKQKFLEQIIRQKLVSDMIDEEGILKDDREYEAFVYFQHLNLIVNRFSELKFENKIDVTMEDIDKEFQANRAMYEQAPLDQAEKYIRQKIQYEKLQALSDEVLSEIKGKHKIVRNAELLKGATSKDPAKRPSEGVLLTVDEKEKLTVPLFNALYYVQHTANYDLTNEEVENLATNEEYVAQNPMLDRKLFFEQLVQMILFHDEAFNGEEFKLKDDKNIIYMLKIQEDVMKVGYYIRKKFRDELNPTDDEINKVYNENKERFKGAPLDQAAQYIHQQILAQRLQQKGNEIVQNAKEQSVIEYNLKALSDAKEEKEEKEEKKEEE